MGLGRRSLKWEKTSADALTARLIGVYAHGESGCVKSARAVAAVSRAGARARWAES